MVSRTAIALGFALAVTLAGSLPAIAAPCPQACRGEVAACRDTECAALTGKARRHCRRSCAKGIIRDCNSDPIVCGATAPRPKPKPGPTPPPVGGW